MQARAIWVNGLSLSFLAACASGGGPASNPRDASTRDSVQPEDAATHAPDASQMSDGAPSLEMDAGPEEPLPEDAGPSDSGLVERIDSGSHASTDAEVSPVDSGPADSGIAPIDSGVCVPSAVPSTGNSAVDGDLGTGYVTGYHDWQSLEIDLGCEMTIGAFRRHMSTGGATTGIRSYQGETVEYQDKDGAWRRFTEPDACGWPNYYMTLGTAWRDLPYGWSPWLVLDVPVSTRRLRYLWDGHGTTESLDEIEVLDGTPPGWVCDR